ncbi:hypothetical protein D3C71_1979760 [compost metagenome]
MISLASLLTVGSSAFARVSKPLAPVAASVTPLSTTLASSYACGMLYVRFPTTTDPKDTDAWMVKVAVAFLICDASSPPKVTV